MQPRTYSKKEKIFSNKTNEKKWFAVAFLIIVSTLSLVFYRSNYEARSIENYERPVVSKPIIYEGKVTKMTTIAVTVDEGVISIPLDILKKKKIVNFDYPKKRIPSGTGTEPLSLMAYITPSGKLFTGTSYCPPCRSKVHDITADGSLTCKTCGTKRDLETLKGISGGCINYPTDELPATIKNGKVLIEESVLEDWKPKPL